MDYQKFKQDFLSSGLSQSNYGKQIGMSTSMVSYYLKKSKEEKKQLPSFSSLTITKPTARSIKIKTSSGIEIEIPI